MDAIRSVSFSDAERDPLQIDDVEHALPVAAGVEHALSMAGGVCHKWTGAGDVVTERVKVDDDLRA
jgi:hypothetical protein